MQPVCLREAQLTHLRDGVGIDVTGQLDWPLESSVWDPAVGQPEALSLAGFTGELPEDLHGAGVHHLGEEGGRCWHWMEKEEESDERLRADGLDKQY